MNHVALFTDHPDDRTSEAIRTIIAAGFVPIIIGPRDSETAIAQTIARHKESATELFLVDSFNHPMEASSEIARFLRSHRPGLKTIINLRDPLTDTFLLTVHALGVHFEFLRTYQTCRLKHLARERLASQGIQHALHPIEQHVPPLPYPFIAKPVTGFGSLAVEVITTQDEFSKYLAEARAKARASPMPPWFDTRAHVLAETHLQGMELELDGFFFEGQPRFCAFGQKIHRSVDGHPRELGGLTWLPGRLPLLRQQDELMACWGTNTLSKLDYTAGAFHIEAIRLNTAARSATGEPFELIEVNPRPGGGAIRQIVRAVSGVDLVHEATRLWLGLPPHHEPSPQATHSILYSVLYPERAGRVTNVAGGFALSPTLLGVLCRAAWIPLVSPGQYVGIEREYYLGEIHLENPELSAHSLEEWVDALQDWLRSQSLVTIQPELESRIR